VVRDTGAIHPTTTVLDKEDGGRWNHFGKE